MVIEKDKWEDFDDTIIDILVVVNCFNGHLFIEYPVDMLQSCLFNSIDVQRSVARVYVTASSPLSHIIGPVQTTVKLSSFGEAVFRTIPSFRKAMALCNHNFEREAIPLIKELQLSELNVFLTHNNSKIRDVAKIRFDFLICQRRKY